MESRDELNATMKHLSWQPIMCCKIFPTPRNIKRPNYQTLSIPALVNGLKGVVVAIYGVNHDDREETAKEFHEAMKMTNVESIDDDRCVHKQIKGRLQRL